jgi:transcription initiation factor IIE alpha subunit
MSLEQKIKCPFPDCASGEIYFNTYQLLQGHRFTCPECGGSMGLDPQSYDTVKETMNEFENLKKQLLTKKKKHNST